MDLQTLKNTYAQEQGYRDWSQLYEESGRYDETIFFNHEYDVIILAQEAALENAYERLDPEGREVKSPFRSSVGRFDSALSVGRPGPGFYQPFREVGSKSFRLNVLDGWS